MDGSESPKAAEGLKIATVLMKRRQNGVITSKELWPFPNPTLSRGSTNPNRGFCASLKQLNGVSDMTLTSYYWEYFGNMMHEFIYTNGNDQDCSCYSLPCQSAELTTDDGQIISVTVSEGRMVLERETVTIPNSLDFIHFPMDMIIFGISDGTTIDFTCTFPDAIPGAHCLRN